MSDELVLCGLPPEQPPLDERVDGDDLATLGCRHAAQHDGGATLVAADLQQYGSFRQSGRLIVQEPGLAPGQPTGDLVGDRPSLLEGGIGIFLGTST